MRQGWFWSILLACVCFLRYGSLEHECSTLPGWSHHHAHLHYHDALHSEGRGKHSGKKEFCPFPPTSSLTSPGLLSCTSFALLSSSFLMFIALCFTVRSPVAQQANNTVFSLFSPSVFLPPPPPALFRLNCVMLAHFLWLSKWCWRGKSFSIKCHTFCHLYLSVVISCFHVENVKSFSSPSFLALRAPLLTLSLLLPVSLSFSSLLNALFSNSEFFPFLAHFLLFDITPFVPVVSGPALPGGDRFSHSHSDVTQSISEGDKLSFKLLSVLKWKRKKMKGKKKS